MDKGIGVTMELQDKWRAWENCIMIVILRARITRGAWLELEKRLKTVGA